MATLSQLSSDLTTALALKDRSKVLEILEELHRQGLKVDFAYLHPSQNRHNSSEDSLRNPLDLINSQESQRRRD